MEPYLLSVSEACAVGGIGRTALYERINAGEIRAVKCGRRTLIPWEEMRSWMDGLPPIISNIVIPNGGETRH
jgi:excisionase family DNA binding protein